MEQCEYFTDALGAIFPKEVKSNEIRILANKSIRSINLCYPQIFTSEERKFRLSDLKVIVTEIEKNSNFMYSQVFGKPLNTFLIEKISNFIEDILNEKVFLDLIYHDYKVTYWVQE